MSEESGQLADLLRRYEAACGADDGPDLDQFLPPSGDPLRPAAVAELVKLDMEAHWRHGRQVRIEEYLARFPELGTARTVPPALIVAEFRVRLLYGDQPELEVYRRRFPDQFPECERLAQAGALLHAPTQSGTPDLLARLPKAEAPAEDPAADSSLPDFLAVVPRSEDDLLAGFATPTRAPGQGVVLPPEVAPTHTPAKPPQVVGPGQPAPQTPTFVPLSGGYKLIKKLGAGGFAEVWKAEAPGGFPAAVKKIFHALDHEEAQRELAALETVQRLSHPFLLQTQASWATEGQLWIAMELAEGSLRDRLKECRRAGLQGIPAVELLGYMREAAEALDYLHSEKVQHRDIKPDNILLQRGHAKVADFGLARLQEKAKSMTVTGSGTPAYMPPEAWAGKLHSNSDQYSLAITYIELRLDRRPFTGASPAELMMAHLQTTPDLAPLSPQEQAVILRGMARKPEERYPSCTEFVQALLSARPEELEPPKTRTSGGEPAPVSNSSMRPPGTGASAAATDESLGAPGWRGARAQRLSDTDVRRTGGRSSTWRNPVSGGALPKVVLLIACIPALGFAIAIAARLFRPTGSVVLKPPAEVFLPAGVTSTVAVPIERNGFDGAVQVSLGDGPKGLTVEPVTATARDTTVVVPVTPDPNAPPAEGEVTLVATAGGRTYGKGTFHVQIGEGVDFLPPGFRKQAEAKVVQEHGKRYYNRIERVLADGTPIPFVLIPRDPQGQPRGHDVLAFYIMVDKVSVDLFTRVKGEATKLKIQNNQWEKEPVKGKQPVFSVVAEDAYNWSRYLGGTLPSVAEWDKAAGLYRAPLAGLKKDARWPPPWVNGPFLESWNEKDPLGIAINRPEAEGPLEVGQATQDRAWSGCRDMAGNGRELTRTLLSTPITGFVVPLADGRTAGPQDRVVVRGHDYTQRHPLYFRDLEKTDEWDSIDYNEPGLHTGFRVVVEIPEK